MNPGTLRPEPQNEARVHRKPRRREAMQGRVWEEIDGIDCDQPYSAHVLYMQTTRAFLKDAPYKSL